MEPWVSWVMIGLIGAACYLSAWAIIKAQSAEDTARASMKEENE